MADNGDSDYGKATGVIFDSHGGCLCGGPFDAALADRERGGYESGRGLDRSRTQPLPDLEDRAGDQEAVLMYQSPGTAVLAAVAAAALLLRRSTRVKVTTEDIISRDTIGELVEAYPQLCGSITEKSFWEILVDRARDTAAPYRQASCGA